MTPPRACEPSWRRGESIDARFHQRLTVACDQLRHHQVLAAAAADRRLRAGRHHRDCALARRRRGARAQTQPRTSACARHDGDLLLPRRHVHGGRGGRPESRDRGQQARDRRGGGGRRALPGAGGGRVAPRLQGHRRRAGAGTRRHRRNRVACAHRPDAAGDRAAAPDDRSRPLRRQYARSGARSL